MNHSQEPEDSLLPAAVASSVRDLIKAARRTRVWNTIQSAMIAILAITVIVVVLMYISQQDATRMNCLAGNDYKARQTQIWDKLFQISYADKAPTAHARALGQEFLNYVSTTNAPRDCG